MLKKLFLGSIIGLSIIIFNPSIKTEASIDMITHLPMDNLIQELKIEYPAPSLKRIRGFVSPFQAYLNKSLEDSMNDNFIRIKDNLNMFEQNKEKNNYFMVGKINEIEYKIFLEREVLSLINDISLDIDMVLNKTSENTYELINFRFLDYEGNIIDNLQKGFLLQKIDELKEHKKDLIIDTIGLVRNIENNIAEVRIKNNSIIKIKIETNDYELLVGETYEFQYLKESKNGIFELFHTPKISELKISEFLN